jgi:hypothetical protein
MLTEIWIFQQPRVPERQALFQQTAVNFSVKFTVHWNITLIRDRNTHKEFLLLTVFNATKATLSAAGSSGVTDSCILRDINSTMYCIAQHHYVTTAPFTVLTVCTLYWNFNVSVLEHVKNWNLQNSKSWDVRLAQQMFNILVFYAVSFWPGTVTVKICWCTITAIKYC